MRRTSFDSVSSFTPPSLSENSLPVSDEVKSSDLAKDHDSSSPKDFATHSPENIIETYSAATGIALNNISHTSAASAAAPNVSPFSNSNDSSEDLSYQEIRKQIDLSQLENLIVERDRKLGIKGNDKRTFIFTSTDQNRCQLFSEYIEGLAQHKESDESYSFVSDYYTSINPLLQQYGITLFEARKYVIEESNIPYFLDPQCLELAKLGFDICFIKQIHIFNDRLKMFFPKKALTEKENAALDEHRLTYVKDIFEFVLQRKQTTFIFDKVGKIEIHNHRMNTLNLIFQDTKIDMFVKGLTVLTKITGGFRHQFKPTLYPEPFTWETFEHLGGILQFLSYETYTIIPSDSNPSVKERYTKTFLYQIINRKNIIGCAFDDICKYDLQNLLNFVEKMKNIFPSKNNTFNKKTKFSFTASKALVTNMINQETLSNLLMLCNNDFLDPNAVPEKEKLSVVQPKGYAKAFAVEPKPGSIMLDTKMQKQYLLNRLIEIGEFCTGKYLSTDLKQLQNGNPLFKMLIDIRDALIHQETDENRKRINQILDDQPTLLNNILSNDMPKLLNKFFGLASSLYINLSNFTGGPKEVWEKIYDEFKTTQDTIRDKAKNIKFSTTQQKFSQTAADGLKNAEEKEEVQKFLQGTGALSVETEKNLEGLNFFKTTKGSKILKKAIDETKEMYAITKQQDLIKDFPHLFRLHQLFEEQDSSSSGALKELPSNIAIQAINDIKDVLHTIGVKPLTGDPNEWVRANEENFRKLQSQDFLNYQYLNAIKYNVQICLQQLDVIKKKFDPTAFNNYKVLGQKYEQILRPLRNFLTHGNRLIDLPTPHDNLVGHMNEKKIQSIISSLYILFTEVEPDLERFVHEAASLPSALPSSGKSTTTAVSSPAAAAAAPAAAAAAPAPSKASKKAAAGQVKV